MQLSIKNLTKTYSNGIQALKNINLEISSGMYGLLGPNGAGKSTLMRTIATLQDADEGTIQFNQIDILKQKNELKKKLGYLPQDFGIYPELTAVQMLSHITLLKGISEKKERKRIVLDILEQTNLAEVQKRKLSSFSGGMKQRFGIAQALIGDPQLLIVDEPTAGLDPEERNRFHNILSDISEDRIVILSTHIVEDVRVLCENMGIIHDGKILFSGNTSESISKLKGKIWEKIIEKDELVTYKDNYNVILTHMFTGRILVHILSEKRPENNFEAVSPGLEDVYFSIIKEEMSTKI